MFQRNENFCILLTVVFICGRKNQELFWIQIVLLGGDRKGLQRLAVVFAVAVEKNVDDDDENVDEDDVSDNYVIVNDHMIKMMIVFVMTWWWWWW